MEMIYRKNEYGGKILVPVEARECWFIDHDELHKVFAYYDGAITRFFDIKGYYYPDDYLWTKVYTNKEAARDALIQKKIDSVNRAVGELIYTITQYPRENPDDLEQHSPWNQKGS